MSRDTGPDRASRQRVCARARFCCEICGGYAVGGQIHHRRPRQMGGSREPAINSPANLLLLCPLCHRYLETLQRRSAYAYGWLCPAGTDPARCRALVCGTWVLLDADGRYRTAGEPNRLEPF